MNIGLVDKSNGEDNDGDGLAAVGHIIIYNTKLGLNHYSFKNKIHYPSKAKNTI